MILTLKVINNTFEGTRYEGRYHNFVSYPGLAAVKWGGPGGGTGWHGTRVVLLPARKCADVTMQKPSA